MDAKERDLAQRAASQEGVFSRSQAISLGIPERKVEWWVTSEAVERLVPGVYALPGTKDCWLRRLWAGYLWCGQGAVVSHRAAAALHGLEGLERGAVIEITVAKLCRPPEGFFLRFTGLAPDDICNKRSFAVTTVARTLLDLCAVVPRTLVLKATKSALREGLVTAGQLVDVLERYGKPGREGVAMFRSILEEVDAFGVLGSELDDLVMHFLRTRGFPEPVRQHPVPVGDGRHYFIDFAYPEWKIALEAEGFVVHTRQSWESDIERRNFLNHKRWRIFHTTWSRISRDPDEVEQELRAFLERFGGWTG